MPTNTRIKSFKFLLFILLMESVTPTLTDQILILNVTQQIQNFGYPVENYPVITDDGYILQIQRIPHGKKVPTTTENVTKTKEVVFLQHGLMQDATIFIANQSLAFKLADAGFDVWLGNFRGSCYGSQHVKLSVYDSDFWNFGWDEMAALDIPAMLNTVLNVTGANKIFYTGSSLGVVTGFMLLASQPQWNQKIKGFAGIEPISRVTYSTWPKLRDSKILGLIADVLSQAGFSFVINRSLKYYLDMTGGNNKNVNVNGNCQTFECGALGWMMGYDPTKNSKPTQYIYPQPKEKFQSSCKSTTSLKALYQGYQESNAKQLMHYSYGWMNLFVYQSWSPPWYNLSKISVPVALFSCDNDPVADPLDISLLIRDLPHLYTHFVHPFVMYSHSETQSDLLETMNSKIAHTISEMAKTFI